VNSLVTAFKRELNNCSKDIMMNVILYKNWLEKLEEEIDKVKILEGKTLDEVSTLMLTSLEQKEASDNNL